MTQAALQLGSRARRVDVVDVGFYLSDWSDFALTFTVSGRLIVKKSHHKAVQIGELLKVVNDTEYGQWERRAWEELRLQWALVGRPIPKHVELNLRVLTYLPTLSGWPDLAGTYEGPQDVLEAHKRTCDLTPGQRDGNPKCKKHAGIYVNDKMIKGHVGSEVILDRGNPARAVFTLTPPITCEHHPRRPS